MRTGLIGAVHPATDLAIAAFAERLARGPRMAHGYIRRNLLAAETESLATILELEALHQIRTAFTENHHEAIEAFAEKREPQFRGS
ncbi:hypothetical protein E2C06_23800 [Dankookia rubra]|uniref:Enoyl-CoA hydratase n=1 Tax=Dankookia rubra TaxID=1442381 RepID=A0A4R5QAM3_9PROT|nr:hypothetical protein E2C06_23800 [Dankookia rubra]